MGVLIKFALLVLGLLVLGTQAFEDSIEERKLSHNDTHPDDEYEYHQGCNTTADCEVGQCFDANTNETVEMGMNCSGDVTCFCSTEAGVRGPGDGGGSNVQGCDETSDCGFDGHCFDPGTNSLLSPVDKCSNTDASVPCFCIEWKDTNQGCEHSGDCEGGKCFDPWYDAQLSPSESCSEKSGPCYCLDFCADMDDDDTGSVGSPIPSSTPNPTTTPTTTRTTTTTTTTDTATAAPPAAPTQEPTPVAPAPTPAPIAADPTPLPTPQPSPVPPNVPPTPSPAPTPPLVISHEIAGFVQLGVDDPPSYVADPVAEEATARAIASEAGVPSDSVQVDLSLPDRRLVDDKSRRLQKGVVEVAYVIQLTAAMVADMSFITENLEKITEETLGIAIQEKLADEGADYAISVYQIGAPEVRVMTTPTRAPGQDDGGSGMDKGDVVSWASPLACASWVVAASAAVLGGSVFAIL